MDIRWSKHCLRVCVIAGRVRACRAYRPIRGTLLLSAKIDRDVCCDTKPERLKGYVNRDDVIGALYAASYPR